MNKKWEPNKGDRVIRHPREEELQTVRVSSTERRSHSKIFGSPLMLMYIFLGLIIIGTILLLMPFSTVSGDFTPFIDALFTATSASTVTGLTTLNTATHWSSTGQAIILTLIFIGGLGIMTVTGFLLILLGHRVSLSQQVLIKDSFQINRLGGLAKITLLMVGFAVLIQTIGFFVLLVRLANIYPFGQAIWQSLFHSVSAFNNAGFVIFPNSESLSNFKSDYLILLIIGTLIFVGSIGYWTILDIGTKISFSKLHLNTKLVIITTIILILIGTLFFLISENNNPKTIKDLPLIQQIYISLFESISGRTSGFSTVHFGETNQHTNFFFTALMLIGGSAASVAGGIKVNTLAIIVISVFSTIRCKSYASVFGREIPKSQIRLSISIGILAISCAFITSIILSITENQQSFINVWFETVSALGTVGLTTGLSEQSTSLGKLILAILMFVGRIAPMTLALIVTQNLQKPSYKLAEEELILG